MNNPAELVLLTNLIDGSEIWQHIGALPRKNVWMDEYRDASLLWAQRQKRWYVIDPDGGQLRRCSTASNKRYDKMRKEKLSL